MDGDISFKVASKRSKHAERLAERIQKNAEIADEIIGTVKSLVNTPDTDAEINRLIDTVQDLLDNNAKLRDQVGDALEDIPPNG
jgi:hypothetical protein